MDAVNDLARATRLRFDLAFRSRIDAHGITLEEKVRARPGICVVKPAGKLEFALDTTLLQLGVLESGFDILFSGTPVASDIVRWDATLPNAPVKIRTETGDATVDTLEGTIYTKVFATGAVTAWDTFDDMGYLQVGASASRGTVSIDVSKLGIVGLAGDTV